MTFGVKAIIPAEMGLSSYQVENYDEEANTDQMMAELNLIEEKREQALILITTRNQVVAIYYNKKFQPRTFKVKDLVLKKVLIQNPELGSFSPKWEGPFMVIGIIRLGTYQLADQDRTTLGHLWNADHLKRFYQ